MRGRIDENREDGLLKCPLYTFLTSLPGKANPGPLHDISYSQNIAVVCIVPKTDTGIPSEVCIG